MEKNNMQENSSLIIEGRNAVNEALKAGRSFDKLFIQDQVSKDGPIKAIIAKARKKGIVVRFESKENMDKRSQGTSSGVIDMWRLMTTCRWKRY